MGEVLKDFMLTFNLHVNGQCYKIVIVFAEIFVFEIVSVLKRFKAMLLQKNETVEAMQGYLMQSIKAELEETHALYMRRKNMKQYNIFNQ
ncbi:hypothetical protein APW67_14635 (plasmid) [Staphylococcus aureus]|nr:hypothetical protein APW67_14635 [Staphylococcus aureus]